MADEDVIIKLRLAADQFQREMDEALGAVAPAAEKAGEQTGEKFAAGINKKAALIGAAIGAGAILVQQAISRSMALAQELDASSQQLGVGVERLQEWRYAAGQAGIGAEELDGNVGKLTLRIGEASAGSRTAQQAFVGLGVGFQTLDGRARATDEVFADVIDRLSKIEDPAERARRGNELLGESYSRMEPLVRGGADGLREMAAEMYAANAALTREDIDNLNDANAAWAQAKETLSIGIAGVVADNADAIGGLADALVRAAEGAAYFANEYPRATGLIGGAMAGARVGGPWGGVAGGIAGLYAGNASVNPYEGQSINDASNNVSRIQAQLANARAGGDGEGTIDLIADLTRQLGNANEALRAASSAQLEIALDGIRPSGGIAAPPSVSPAANRRRGGSASARQSPEDRERAAAIRESERAEQAFEEAVQRTLTAQADSVRVEETRRELGEAAAAAEEARLSFQRQIPLAVHQTVEALGAALGLTREQIDAQREVLQLRIDEADAAENVAAASAARAVEEREQLARKRDDAAAQAKAQEAIKDQVEEQRRQQEAAVRDVADLYHNLFSGNTNKIWGRFKEQGLSIISDLAAQWTLALLSGQTAGGLLGGGGAGGAQGKLGLLSSAGGLLGGNPATQQGAGQVQGLGNIAGLLGLGGGSGGASAASPIASAIAAVPGLNVAIAAAAVTHVVGEGIEKFTGLRFDALGGLFGGLVGGFAVGALKGAVKGNATIGADGDQLGIVDSFGKKKFRDQAVNDATGVMDTLAQLAQGLGVDLNAGAGAVSIGTRNGKYRVDPSGGGALKPGQGAIDFGKDQQAALEYAVRNLIEDGVLGPISQASRNILTRGGDLQAAIEKAVMIESVPKLLRQRLDPLGAKLEEIDDQFRKLADALAEGGANAEQIAQARKLWQLEREDAIKQIGEASRGLKDFLASLNAGPNSPLSLRQQQAEAEKALAPYVASIEEAKAAQVEVERLKAGGGSAAQISAAEEAARAAAAAVDQGGFQNAAQQVLGISRQINASSGGFFADFDRIRSLTGGAIGAIDGAASNPGEGNDPFSRLTAQNTGDMAAILVDIRALLANNDNSSASGAPPGVKPKKWLKQQRRFSSGG